MDNIVKVGYPLEHLITQEMLEKASELGHLEIKSLLKKLFYRPGVVENRYNSNTLYPVVIDQGTGRVDISEGLAVAYDGSLIACSGETMYVSLAGNLNKTLFVKYVEAVTDDITTINPIDSSEVNVATVKSQASGDIFFWVVGYDPATDADLSDYPDSVPIGKLLQSGGVYYFGDTGGHRRTALINLMYPSTGHWNGEITPLTAFGVSIYNLLACRGHAPRSSANPFGESTSDIQNLLQTVRNLMINAGIPAEDFTVDDNRNYLAPSDLGGGSVRILAGEIVDNLGRRVVLPVATDFGPLPSDSTWYYFYLLYALDASGNDSYSISYQVTAPVSPKYYICRAMYDGVDLVLQDKREQLRCRGAYSPVTAPTVPDGLTLTTGYEADLRDPNLSQTRERPQECWIRATWNPSTSDIGIRWYDLSIIPVDGSGNEIPEMMKTGRQMYIVSGSTVFTSYTFHSLTAGIRFRIRVRAVDLSVKHNTSAWSSYADIIGGVGTSLTMGALTLTELEGGLLVSWTSVPYARGYEMYWKDGIPVPTPPQEEELLSSVPGGLTRFIPLDNFTYGGLSIYVAVRAYDSGGFYSNTSTASLVFGDVTAPSVPTGLALTTGVDIKRQETLLINSYRRNPSQGETAWIKAIWNNSTDNKSGVDHYEPFLTIALDPGDPIPDPGQEMQMMAMEGLGGGISGQTSYTWRGLRPGVKYHVRVRAIDKRGNASASCAWVAKVAGGIRIPTPPPEGGVQLQSRSGGVWVTWPASVDADGYEVFAREGFDPGLDSNYLFYTGKLTSVFIPTGSGTTVYTRVRAYNAAGECSADVLGTGTSNVADVDLLNALNAEVVAARGSSATLGLAIQAESGAVFYTEIKEEGEDIEYMSTSGDTNWQLAGVEQAFKRHSSATKLNLNAMLAVGWVGSFGAQARLYVRYLDSSGVSHYVYSAAAATLSIDYTEISLDLLLAGVPVQRCYVGVQFGFYYTAAPNGGTEYARLKGIIISMEG